jgi:hypothetical protein
VKVFRFTVWGWECEKCHEAASTDFWKKSDAQAAAAEHQKACNSKEVKHG